jgi:ABC-type transport system involved in multi-copper enzyme maturation permease subunit
MSGQLRSELLKLRTTRTVALLLVAAAVLAVFGACVEGLSRTSVELAQEDTQRTMLSGGTVGVLFATLAGLLAVTGEFRYGTIHPTLLFEPRRRVVLVAKVVSAALTGLVFGAVCAAVSFATGLAILSARGAELTLTGPHAAALALGPVAAAALSAVLGVAIGGLIRNQAGAIVALAAYAFVVDAALFGAAPSIGRFLPGKAGDALAGRADESLLAPGMGAAVLLAWTLAFAVAAAVRTERSDV